MRTTRPTRAKEITRKWHLLDAKAQILGKVAVKAAKLLIGKHKAYFIRNLDCGDYVVITNSRAIEVTGKKETQKVYSSYSGYPGGLSKETFIELRQRRPDEVIRHAVYGMLPKNKLRDTMITRLYVYPDAGHPYQNKFQNQNPKS